MIFWDMEAIERGMRRKGIPNRRQLGERAGLSLPTTYAIAKAGRLTRLDIPTLEAIAEVLDVNPLSLLRYEP